MAYFKYCNRKYTSPESFQTLINYLNNREKNPLLIFNNTLNTASPLNFFVLDWCYQHLYNHSENRTFCYHYVLSFNLKHEFSIVKEHQNIIMYNIYCSDFFKDKKKLICAHRTPNNIVKHLHIIIDSIDSVNGKAVFIPHDKLIQEIGEELKIYRMALEGYTCYDTSNRLIYASVSREYLY